MRVANSVDSLVTDPTLPPEIEDGSAWYGSDLANCDDWIEHLSPAEIAEVEHALRQLDAKRTDFTSITASDVPLPTLARRLQRILDEVLNGRGFVLMKGLPVELWTKREAAIAFWRLEFTSATCGCRTPKDTCSGMLEIWDARATIQTRESIR